MIFMTFYDIICDIHWSFQVLQGVWQIWKMDFPDNSKKNIPFSLKYFILSVIKLKKIIGTEYLIVHKGWTYEMIIGGVGS